MPRLRTTDGLSLYYEERGSGAPMVFVHEFGGDHRSWEHQVACFGAAYRCIAYSARGFKPSSVPDDPSLYGQRQASGDLLGLIEALGLGPVHLVGASMGSFTSLDVALADPQRVASLTLVGNSSGPRDDDERERYCTGWLGPEIERRLTEGAAGGVAVLEQDPAYRRFRATDPDGWERYAARLGEQSWQGAVNILRTLHWERRSLWHDRERLAALDIPVLLVMGEEDYYLVGETNQFLHATLPQSRLQVFPEAGHLVNVERPDAFNELLVSFLEMSNPGGPPR